MAYLSLFLTSFASATLLPGGSEVLFTYLLSEAYSPWLLLFFASIGNTLGSFVNYLLGKYAITFAYQKKYITEKSLDKARYLFMRYGTWSLLLSWVPLIGDPLTFVAGIARYSWWKFLLIVGFAKSTRYVFVYLGYLALI